MGSSKLIILLAALVAILVAIMAYLFVNSKPKDISFYEENTTLVQNQNTPQNKIKQNDKNESIEQKVKANETAKAQTQSSLRAEYKAFIQKSKRDKSLGEPRYSVYVLNSKKLNTKERAVINDITSTLSRRGGYLRYSLFVDKNSDERIKIYLFNEKLLDNKKWLTKKLSLPNLWFKFNQSSVQSIKNSFHIKEFKRFNLGVKIKSLNLSGHTDEIGGEFYNSMLGLQRSAAVASEFLRQTGKITLQTYGKDKPLSKGLKEKERYQNRRVEVKFE